jgi:hypothetical protein
MVALKQAETEREEVEGEEAAAVIENPQPPAPPTLVKWKPTLLQVTLLLAEAFPSANRRFDPKGRVVRRLASKTGQAWSVVQDVHMLTIDRDSITWTTPLDSVGAVPEARANATGTFLLGMPRKLLIYGGEGAPEQLEDGTSRATFYSSVFILNAANEAKFEWTNVHVCHCKLRRAAPLPPRPKRSPILSQC